MANTTAEQIDTSSTTILNVTMTNITRLTPSNYLMWRRQVHALLDGYDLAEHLKGSDVPPQTVVTNGQTVSNPSFILWKHQDKLLYSGLLGAISVPVQPLVSQATTTADIWKTLANTYAKPSRGHIKQLKQHLKQVHKGTKTIDEYFQTLTVKFDQLSLLGKSLDHEDQLDCIYNGLPDEYKSDVDQLESRETPPSIPEVHEKLLYQEANLLIAAVVVSPVTANVANTRSRSFQTRPSQRPHSQHSSSQQQSVQSPNPYYHNNNNMSDNFRQSRGYQGRCQLCGVYGHSAKRCPQLPGQNNSRSSTPWKPRANMSLNTSNNSDWLLDSGATHHMTNDLDNLAAHQSYNGEDLVLIGDGSGLAITHTGEGSQVGVSADQRQC